MEPYAEIVDQYREFAAHAADSPTFVAWAQGVAVDLEVQAWIATLPGIKRQPNLVMAAARWHGARPQDGYSALREALLADEANGAAIRTTILTRATQTNEAGRLATLVPAFARIAQAHGQGRPLALLEVGASAGLCLYPDRWSYRWTTEDAEVVLAPDASPDTGPGAGPTRPAVGTLECRVKGPAPLPSSLPRVAWRGGVDLQPLSVLDDDAMAWLTNLVWPEHDDRRARLQQAIAAARHDPPRIVAGDLLEELPGLVGEASAYGPVVVFHSAVIAYLAPQDRRRFDAMMRQLVADGACHWVSNESKLVLPSITATGPAIAPDKQTFVLGIDGRAVAQTHGHGRLLRWTEA